MPAITMAGTGHDHGHSHDAISGTEAQIKATDKMKQLVDAGKIDSTWANIKSSKYHEKELRSWLRMSSYI